MMKQYLQIKEQNQDAILFFRLGDFYEMFGDDARKASKELDLTLTTRDKDKNKPFEEKVPMCGIPYHASDAYIARLIAKGYKVAICEQTQDPATAKGLVDRDIIRVVTPGTVIDAACLEEGRSNFCAGLYLDDTCAGFSVCDISTGKTHVTAFQGPDRAEHLLNELGRFSPAEAVVNPAAYQCGPLLSLLQDKLHCHVERLSAGRFQLQEAERTVRAQFGDEAAGRLPKGNPAAALSLGALLGYLHETQKTDLRHVDDLDYYQQGQFMELDLTARRNLELTETLRSKEKKGSLLWVLDKTRTPMGGRLLRGWIERPLLSPVQIGRRQQAVSDLYEDIITREELTMVLKEVTDLERLIGRVVYGSAGGRDLVALANGLGKLPRIRELLGGSSSALLQALREELDDLPEVRELLQRALVDEPPFSVREGKFIREGYSPEVDRLWNVINHGAELVADLETRTKEQTGIKNMKVRYNKVFGYYIEVAKSQIGLVPEDWVRKQTLTNAERYTTDELKKLEDVILGAEDKLCSLEYDLFNEVRDSIAAEVRRIKSTARAIAEIDVYTALSVVAQQYNYVKPAINEKGIIDIKNGRHPVVEKMIRNDMFVANNTYLDNAKNRISIITGPNMAGKSTYMRQTALIVLMAQIGSFVPAQEANIGIVDRIFTRVGASDDLASGQSTFMVEMTEVANILRNATPKSLLILDEIGRGTSTFDGLSIAWAVVEYIANTKVLGAKTLFATHYHELTELEGTLDGVNNYCIAVKENGDDIVFLRKIIKGGADKSYGIQVAKLAGVPDTVIERAKELVADLSDADISLKARDIAQYSKKQEKLVDSYKKVDDLEVKQMSLFDTVNNDDIIEDIKALDISNMTPIDALNTLYKLQGRVKNRW